MALLTRARIIGLTVALMMLAACLSSEAIAQRPESFDRAVEAQMAKNYVEAARLYRIGANKGYAPSQNELGLLYLLGHGVPLDHVEAYKWFLLASRSQSDRDTANYNRGRAATKMTSEQIREAENRSKEWKPER